MKRSERAAAAIYFEITMGGWEDRADHASRNLGGAAMKPARIKITQPWHPGLRPTDVAIPLAPLWCWSVRQRRCLWARRVHPLAYPHRHEMMNSQVGGRP